MSRCDMCGQNDCCGADMQDTIEQQSKDIAELVEALALAGRRLCKDCARGNEPIDGRHLTNGATLRCLAWPEHLIIAKHAPKATAETEP